MVPSFIARDTLIEAPIDIVWSLVTEPEQITAWFAEEAQVDLRPGGEGSFSFARGGAHPFVVETVEAPHTFAYCWTAPGGGMSGAGHATRVEFALSEEPGGTRVRVTESGLRELPWPEERASAYAREHSEGWEYFLGRLAGHAASQPAVS